MCRSGLKVLLYGEKHSRSLNFYVYGIANSVRYTLLRVNQTKPVVFGIIPLACTAVNSNCPPLSPVLSSSAWSTREQRGEKKHRPSGWFRGNLAKFYLTGRGKRAYQCSKAFNRCSLQVQGNGRQHVPRQHKGWIRSAAGAQEPPLYLQEQHKILAKS